MCWKGSVCWKGIIMYLLFCPQMTAKMGGDQMPNMNSSSPVLDPSMYGFGGQKRSLDNGGESSGYIRAHAAYFITYVLTGPFVRYTLEPLLTSELPQSIMAEIQRYWKHSSEILILTYGHSQLLQICHLHIHELTPHLKGALQSGSWRSSELKKQPLYLEKNKTQKNARIAQTSQFYTSTWTQLTFVDLCNAGSVKLLLKTPHGHMTSVSIRQFMRTHLRFCKWGSVFLNICIQTKLFKRRICLICEAELYKLCVMISIYSGVDWSMCLRVLKSWRITAHISKS